MFRSSHEDRTVPATPRRLADARRQGFAPRNRELTAATVACATAIALWCVGGMLCQAARELFHAAWPRPIVRWSDATLSPESATAVARLVWPAVAVLIVTMLAAIFCGLLQTGFRAVWRWPRPRWSNISPRTGGQRLWSGNGWFTVVQLVARCGAASLLIAVAIAALLRDGTGLKDGGAANVPCSIAGKGVQWTLVLLLLALPDVWAQRRTFHRSLRMTPSELREETRESQKKRPKRTKAGAAVSEQRVSGDSARLDQPPSIGTNSIREGQMAGASLESQRD